MCKVEVKYVHRGTKSPEMREIVEAATIGEAMQSVVVRNGGPETTLITYAHYYPDIEMQRGTKH